jgi:hypothetical protein
MDNQNMPRVTEQAGAAVDKIAKDAIQHGTGIMRTHADGTIERIDPLSIYKDPAATTASAPVPHHVACPQRGYNPLCKGCEATTASASEPSDGEIYEAVSRRADPEGHAKVMAQMDVVLGRAPAPSREAAPGIKTWQERAQFMFGDEWQQVGCLDQYKHAEISDLRVALAQQGEAHAANAGEDTERDAIRFRWLNEDHADAETREKARDLARRLGTSSYFAITRDIDAAIAASAAEQKGPQ